MTALSRSASRAPRCAPRFSGACGVGGRSRRLAPCARETSSPSDRGDLALSESTRTSTASPSVEGGWTGDSYGPPRSPLPPSASLATDHSGRAGALRTAHARSGLKWMCPRRQRVSPSVAPLAGFRVPALGAACAVARHTAARVRGDSRPEHGPAHRAGHERAYPAGRSLRAGRRAVLDGRPPRARSRSRPQGARRRERERADESVGRCRRREIRDVKASRCRARARLQVNSNVK